MRATASSIWRLRRCLYWARLDVAWTADDESDEARDGTQCHALAEGREVHDASPRARALHASYERWCADHGEHMNAEREVVMAYDLATDTARVVPSAGHRDYSSKRDTEVIGTFDAIGDGVDDLKTGQERYCHEEQLKLGALCLARLRDRSDVRARFVFINEQFCYTREFQYDALELDEFADQLRAWDAAIPTSKPVPGSHCRYCPASASCPAALGAMVRVQAQTETLAKHRLPLHASQIESAEHARWTIGQLRAVKQVESAVWGALRAYATEHGAIDLGHGVVWGPRKTTRETIELSGPEAISALQSVLGDRWQSACSFETSKDAIREAARGGPEPMAAVLRKALTALAAVGAVKTSELVKFDEYAATAAE